MLATPEVEEQDLQSSETEVSLTRGMMLSDSLPEGILTVAVNVSKIYLVSELRSTTLEEQDYVLSSCHKQSCNS